MLEHSYETAVLTGSFWVIIPLISVVLIFVLFEGRGRAARLCLFIMVVGNSPKVDGQGKGDGHGFSRSRPRL